MAVAQVDPAFPMGISKFGSKLLQTIVEKRKDDKSDIVIGNIRLLCCSWQKFTQGKPTFIKHRGEKKVLAN